MVTLANHIQTLYEAKLYEDVKTLVSIVWEKFSGLECRPDGMLNGRTAALHGILSGCHARYGSGSDVSILGSY